MNTYTEPLARFAKKIKPKTVLEIGFGYEGFSTQMWLEHSKAKVTTVDQADWQGNAKKMKQPRFTFIKGNSRVEIPKIKGTFDLVYVDGDHRYEGCKTDIINCMPKVKVGGVLLVDDYGVEFGVVDINNGELISDQYGVKQAVDELLYGNEDWRPLTDEFGNDARAFRRLK